MLTILNNKYEIRQTLPWGFFQSLEGHIEEYHGEAARIPKQSKLKHLKSYVYKVLLSHTLTPIARNNWGCLSGNSTIWRTQKLPSHKNGINMAMWNNIITIKTNVLYIFSNEVTLAHKPLWSEPAVSCSHQCHHNQLHLEIPLLPTVQKWITWNIHVHVIANIANISC